MNRDIDPRAEYYLNLWRDWMRKHDASNGYPGKSSGFVTGGINAWDDFADTCDNYAALVADASIESLDSLHKAVICHIYLQQVFRFRAALEDILPLAVESFMLQMRKRGLD